MEINKIYNENCLDTMARMPDGFIDLTVTSPPYDNLRTYNGYCFDFENVAKELFRVTKQGGVVVWVVGDATIKGSETGTSFKQALYFKEIGFNLHDTMIYQKSSQPRQNGYRYEQAFEYMFVFSKGSISIKNIIQEPSLNAGKNVKRTCRDGGLDTLKESTNIVSEYKTKGNIWQYGSKKNDTEHPAIFPEALANDHIISWSNPNDVIMDCFAGSGTTGIMAYKNNRKFILIEVSETYCDIIKQRFDSRFNLEVNICH
jgi:site-specific DNA-methyltransferase (adenine-specific)